jgi:hypothetical protein
MNYLLLLLSNFTFFNYLLSMSQFDRQNNNFYLLKKISIAVFLESFCNYFDPLRLRYLCLFNYK